MARPGLSQPALLRLIDDASRGAPVGAVADMVGELEQGQLALEAHHAVELGNLGQGLSRAEAREVTSHGEMAVDAGNAQVR